MKLEELTIREAISLSSMDFLFANKEKEETFLKGLRIAMSYEKPPK